MGAAEQYIISGSGAQNAIKPDSSATYHITFDPQTQVITVNKKGSRKLIKGRGISCPCIIYEGICKL